MVKVEISYEGDLHCDAVHEPSGAHVQTDAPVDNQGEGACFSPTDLVGTALGTCMLTLMGMAARSRGIDITGARAVVEKSMSDAPPRRIAELKVVIYLPAGVDEAHRQRLETAALTCPVHKSLHPDTAIPVTFVWG